MDTILEVRFPNQPPQISRLALAARPTRPPIGSPDKPAISHTRCAPP